MPITRLKSLLAAMSLGVALALSPAIAEPATAQPVPIHYLEDGDVPAAYRYFTLDTTGYPAGKMRLDGSWRDAGTYIYPLSPASTVTFPGVGTWTAPDGSPHPIDMTLSIVDWNGFAIERHAGSVPWIYNFNAWSQANLPSDVIAAMGDIEADADGYCLSTLRASFTFADGTPVPESFRGVTGFNDLDGLNPSPTTPGERITLTSGFDGAYLLRDHRLSITGGDTFSGLVGDCGDESKLDSGLQPLHRLAATWQGGEFTFSYGGHESTSFHTVFGAPIDTANLKWTLRATCVDDDGSVIRTVEEGRTVRMGDTWDFTPQGIEGYTYLGLADGSAPLKGSITPENLNDQTVTMRYARHHAVTAICVDGNGNTIRGPWTVGEGLLRGDGWDVTPPPRS